MTIATSYEQVTYNSPDGAQIGRSSSEKIGFFGTTPAVRPAVSYNATITVSWATQTSGFHFATSDGVISLIGAVKDIQHVLTTFGLWE
jgi:hypothetical protein